MRCWERPNYICCTLRFAAARRPVPLLQACAAPTALDPARLLQVLLQPYGAASTLGKVAKCAGQGGEDSDAACWLCGIC